MWRRKKRSFSWCCLRSCAAGVSSRSRSRW
jgi:hypothetical protein